MSDMEDDKRALLPVVGSAYGSTNDSDRSCHSSQTETRTQATRDGSVNKAGFIYCGSRKCRNFFLHTVNAKVLAFLWRSTYTGEFLTVLQSLKYVICRNTFTEDICMNLSNGQHTAEETQVYQIFTTWQTIMLLAWVIPSLFILPLIGMYLDRGKTKDAFVIATAFQALSSIFLLLNAVYPEIYISGYMTASVLHALYGFVQGFRLITFAYVAQVTTHYSPAKRSKNMIGLTTARAVSGIIFPITLGIIIERYGFTITYILTLAIDVAAFFYAVVLLPDPVPIIGLSHKAPMTGSWWVSFKAALWQIFSPLYNYPRIIVPVGLAFFILDGLTTSTVNFLPIYLTHSPIGFDSQQLGTFLTYIRALVVAGTLFISHVFIKLVGEHDQGLILACFIGRLFTFSVYIVAKSEFLIYIAMLSDVINVTYIGAGFAYLSRAIPGSINKISAFTLMAEFSLIGSVTTFPLVTWIYRQTVEWYPQFVFFFLIALALIGLIIWSCFMWYTQKPMRDNNERKMNSPAEVYAAIARDRSSSDSQHLMQS